MYDFKAAPLSVKPQVEKIIGRKLDDGLLGDTIALSPNEVIKFINLGVINPCVHWNGNPNAMRLLRFHFQHPDAILSYKVHINFSEEFIEGHIYSVTLFLQSDRNWLLKRNFLRSFCDCHDLSVCGTESCSAWWD